LTAPCYLCGKPSVLDGLCQSCYDKGHPLVEFTSPLSIETCKRCGSVKIPGGWKTVGGKSQDEEREKQVEILLDMEIKPLVEDVNIILEEENRLDRVLHLRVHAIGRSAPSLDEHEEEYPLEIRFTHSICDTCSMISGGYYEAILQIRADDRPVSETEEKEITEIARERTIAAYGKDNKAFILDIMEDKYGFDIYFGSEHLCKRVAEEIDALYLSERKDNYKLVSQERGGKGKYRITILLRLPRYIVGDYVEVSGNPCQVLKIGKGGLECYDLVTRQKFTVSKKSAKWRTISFITEESSKRAFSVVSNVYEQSIQLMDSESYEMLEIEPTEEIKLVESGMTIHLLNYQGRWYVVPSEYDFIE